MSVAYHIGRKAIAARLGYKSPRMVDKFVIREGLPVYKRIEKNPRGVGSYPVLAISESAITAWELAKGARFVQQRRAEAEAKPGKRHYALAG